MKRFICIQAVAVSFQDLITPVSAWVVSPEAYSYWSCVESGAWCYWHVHFVWLQFFENICGSRILIPLWFKYSYSAVVKCIVGDHCSSVLETFCTYTTDVWFKVCDMSEAVCHAVLQKTDAMESHRSCHNQCFQKACAKKLLSHPAFTHHPITTDAKCMSLSHQ
jgi:hypothetical protein